MGLDMYLTARKYVKNWDHMNLDEQHTVTVTKAGKPFTTEMTVKEVLYEAAYWRKANQIHKWFIDNVANGNDNCNEVYVTREQLQTLLDLCEQVKATAIMKPSKVQNGSRITAAGEEPIYEDGLVIVNDEEIAHLLPTSRGFFFGSTDYNEYYMHDIDSTIKQLAVVLNQPDEFDFYYEASW